MPSTRALIVALAAFGAVWFATLDHRKIIKADEGRYAEIAREMVASGDWLTPRLNGFKYFEKPPLQHWATATAFTWFGINEWTARLWTALTGFLGVLLLYGVGNRAFGPPAGLYCAAALAGSVLYVFLGHFLSLDMGVTFFMTLAALSFLLAQLDDTPEPRRRAWMLTGWAGMALAVLSKGLIGVVLPAAAVAAYVLAQRDWRVLRRLELVRGTLVFVLLAAPWFIAVSLANPEFFRFFFVHEHFERFLTTVHGRYEPAWYFFPVLAIGLMPWLPAAVPAVWLAWKADPELRFRPGRFLVLWCLVVFVFFSASSSKLPSYVLPIVPAVALLLGRYLPLADRRLLAAQAAIAAAAGLGAMALSLRVESFSTRDLPATLLAGYAPWIGVAGAALAAAGLAALASALRAARLAATLVLSAGALAFVQLTMAGHESLAPAYSAYHTVQRIRPELEADARFYEAPFYFVNTFDHSLLFYLGRTVTMVAYADELAVPISWEPHKFLPDIEAFAAAWAREARGYAVLAPADYERLRARPDLPMQVIASDPRRVVVKKP